MNDEEKIAALDAVTLPMPMLSGGADRRLRVYRWQCGSQGAANVLSSKVRALITGYGFQVVDDSDGAFRLEGPNNGTLVLPLDRVAEIVRPSPEQFFDQG